MEKRQGRSLALEIFAMLLIGSGVVRLIRPADHVRRWAFGPWKDFLLRFENRTAFMRATGVVRLLLGAALVPRIPTPRRWWPF